MACPGAGRGCFAHGRDSNPGAALGGHTLSRRDAINKVFQNKVASTYFYCCFLFVFINTVYSVASYLRVIWQNAHHFIGAKMRQGLVKSIETGGMLQEPPHPKVGTLRRQSQSNTKIAPLACLRTLYSFISPMYRKSVI